MHALSHVHDPRHRHSYELRPDHELDASLRTLAADLEGASLLEPGASTAPRFHPHLTFCRAASPDREAVANAAAAIADAGTGVTLDRAGTFGDGRIVWLAPASRAELDAARARVLAILDPAEVDPLATSRPWTPHVTIAYAVPERARSAALAFVEARLPIAGSWRCVQAWDLDVRPTMLLHELPCVRSRRHG